MSFEYKITPKDVYGTDTPEIPEGWEAVEFRPIRVDDFFLPTDNSPVFGPCTFTGSTNTARLILRRKKVRKVIFTEIRRDSQPSKGEWFLDSSGRYGKWEVDTIRGHYFLPTTIYRREEVEE